MTKEKYLQNDLKKKSPSFSDFFGVCQQSFFAASSKYQKSAIKALGTVKNKYYVADFGENSFTIYKILLKL